MYLKDFFIYLCKNQDQSQVGTFPSDYVKSLRQHFSSEEISGRTVKADALIANRRFREGFQDGSFFVDSGVAVPHKVICYKSGKTTCSCSFFARNNLCFHALAIAKHKDRLPGLLKCYPGRKLNNLATNNVPKGVGRKVPPRKRATNTAVCTPHLSEDRNQGSDHLSVEQVDPTKIIIRKKDRPEDPPITSPLVVKTIAGGIRKCAGCSKGIKNVVIGFNQDEDSQYCLAKHEAYYFWNKNASCFKLTSGSRHYHLNPVCTKSHSSLVKKISKGGIDTPESLLDLLKERFHHVDIID